MLLVRFGDHEKLRGSIAWRDTIARAFEGRCLKCGGLHLGMPGNCMGPEPLPEAPKAEKP